MSTLTGKIETRPPTYWREVVARRMVGIRDDSDLFVTTATALCEVAMRTVKYEDPTRTYDPSRMTKMFGLERRNKGGEIWYKIRESDIQWWQNMVWDKPEESATEAALGMLTGTITDEPMILYYPSIGEIIGVDYLIQDLLKARNKVEGRNLLETRARVMKLVWPHLDLNLWDKEGALSDLMLRKINVKLTERTFWKLPWNSENLAKHMNKHGSGLVDRVAEYFGDDEVFGGIAAMPVSDSSQQSEKLMKIYDFMAKKVMHIGFIGNLGKWDGKPRIGALWPQLLPVDVVEPLLLVAGGKINRDEIALDVEVPGITLHQRRLYRGESMYEELARSTKDNRWKNDKTRRDMIEGAWEWFTALSFLRGSYGMKPENAMRGLGLTPEYIENYIENTGK